MGWSDWINVIVNVAQVAEKVIGLLGFAEKGSGAEGAVASIGGIHFSATTEAGLKIVATNKNPAPVTATFIAPAGAPVQSIAFNLQQGAPYDVTPYVTEFAGGSLSIGNGNGVARRMTETPETLTNAIAFAIRGVTVGSMVWLVNGLQVVVERTPNGARASIVSTATPPRSVQAVLKLVNQDASVTLTGSGGADLGDPPTPLLSWDIPKSLLEIDAVIDELDLTLMLPEDAVLSPDAARAVPVKVDAAKAAKTPARGA